MGFIVKWRYIEFWY